MYSKFKRIFAYSKVKFYSYLLPIDDRIKIFLKIYSFKVIGLFHKLKQIWNPFYRFPVTDIITDLNNYIVFIKNAHKLNGYLIVKIKFVFLINIILNCF